MVGSLLEYVLVKPIESSTNVLRLIFLASDSLCKWLNLSLVILTVMQLVLDGEISHIPISNLLKVVVDERDELPARFSIQGIHIIKFFCEGEEVGQNAGNGPQKVLEKKIGEISNEVSTCLMNTSFKKK